MIEHAPWIGNNYPNGINGNRIAIVGYSHHRDEADADSNDFTLRVVDDITNGRHNDPFFTAIRNHFGFDNHAEFWSRVIFFNFLPDCVGLDCERYNYGTEDQNKRGQERFLRIVSGPAPNIPHPHKVFVFTKKGWENCPPTLEEEKPNGRASPLDFSDFSWGTYRTDNHVIQAYGLRHPERASGDLMQSAVQYIMSLPRATCC